MLNLIRLLVAALAFATMAVTGPALNQASAVGRDPHQQPFTSTSIWNMPVGSGAILVPAKIAPPTIKALTLDQTIVIQDPTSPMTAIAKNGGQHTNTCSGIGTLATDPIPAAFVMPASNHNNEFTVLKSDGQTIDEGGAFARCTAGSGAYASHLKTYGTLFGNGLVGGAGGSRLSTLGGLLRPGEIAPGKLGAPHALRVNIYGAADLYKTTATNCFRWPATRCDGYGPTVYGGTNPALKMGALLVIPASVKCSNFSPAGAELCWTLQNYGAYVGNDSARSVFTITSEEGDANTATRFQTDWGFSLATAGVGGTPWANDVMSLIANLAIVNNNGPLSIGGGGTPRQLLAAALSTSPSPSPSPSSSPSPSPSASPSPSPSPSPRPSPSPSPSPSASPSPGGTTHVLIVMEENKGYSSTLGACSTDPYLCSLAAGYASANSWWGVTHPSEPNYVAYASGATQGCLTDTSCAANSQSATDLGGQLTAKNLPWVGWMESMPSPCYTGAGSSGYALKHNPFGFFKDNYVGTCHIQPYPGIASALSTLNSPNAPDLAWISPNLTNDMHDGTVQQGDAWLTANVAPILASSWFTKYPSTVIITMDEGDGSTNSGSCCGSSGAGGHIPMVVISNHSKGKGSLALTGDNYGTLRTIEEAFGLSLLGAASSSANGDLSSLFG